MKRLLGPVLYAESQMDPNAWSFWLKLYLQGGGDAAPPLTITFFEHSAGAWRQLEDVTLSEPRKEADFSQLLDPAYAGMYWGWHVRVPRANAPRVLKYRITASPGVAFDTVEIPEVVIPARGQLPRAAFFSCNGAPDITQLKGVEPLALWDAMLDEHQRMAYAPAPDGFTLLLGGGDQLYADSLFDSPMELPLLWRFAHQFSQEKRMLFQLGESWEQERARVLAAYVRLYCLNWGEGSGLSEMLARVPGAFTWDDHDILDGWGSQEQLQGCDVYRMIYPEAARAFEAFQLGREGYTGRSLPNPLPKDPPAPHYFQALSFVGRDCDLDVILLDERSGRTDAQVLSPEQKEALTDWRRQHAARAQRTPQHKRHVLLISSVPMVYRYFPPDIELMVSTTIALKSFKLRDDLLDLWESRLHRKEREQLLRELLGHVKEARCAVTIVAGDVHVGAHGRILSREPEHLVDGRPETVIEQLISSGIVHPAVGGIELVAMNTFGIMEPDQWPGTGIETRVVPIADRKMVLTERNWLDIALEPGASSQLHLQWYAERSKRWPHPVTVTPPGG
ncbi:MAG: alkaline phosphatase D family protein [Myxococcaceae bacterium]|nr:alkaline phosphatase D family protein [Myxococcaceae bacterium]